LVAGGETGAMSDLIRRYIDELLDSFGRVTPPVNPAVLWHLYQRKDYASMLGWIKNSMRLDVRVRLRIVESAETSPPMWIETPKQMSVYGTPEFHHARVVVNVRRDVLDTKSFACVVAGFAHELSHVVLFATGHRLQHDEKAVDLTAMILGYKTFVTDAEVTKTEGVLLSIVLMLLALPAGFLFWRGTSSKTWRLGYLTRAEAEAANRYLDLRLCLEPPRKAQG
jgi:hypothetical protein